MTNKQPLRFGILGAGAISTAHIKALNSLKNSGLAELVAVADMRFETAQKIANEQNITAYPSLETMLEHQGLDGVAICTPPNVHADQAVLALNAGKHVVIEKPADVCVAAVKRIEAAQKSSGCLATVISQHRYDTSARVIKQALNAGRFGRLTRAAAQVRWWRPQEYFDAVPWRGSMEISGGGALISQSIHTLDLMVWMMGSVEEVFAYSGVLAHERIEVEDTLAAVLKFSSGAIGVIEASIATYPGLSARLEISGDRGSATIDGDQLIYFHAAEKGEQTSMYGAFGDTNRMDAELAAFGSGFEASSSHEPGQLSSAHQEQYKEFCTAIFEQRPPDISLEDGAYAIRVIEAIHDSARLGQAVKLEVKA